MHIIIYNKNFKALPFTFRLTREININFVNIKFQI